MNWDPRTISKSIKEHRVQKRQTIEMSLVSTHIISGTRIKDPRSKKKREVGGYTVWCWRRSAYSTIITSRIWVKGGSLVPHWLALTVHFSWSDIRLQHDYSSCDNCNENNIIARTTSISYTKMRRVGDKIGGIVRGHKKVSQTSWVRSLEGEEHNYWKKSKTYI